MKDQIKDIVSDAIQCHLQKSLKLIPDAEDEIIDLMAGVEDRIADEVEKLIKQAQSIERETIKMKFIEEDHNYDGQETFASIRNRIFGQQ